MKGTHETTVRQHDPDQGVCLPCFLCLSCASDSHPIPSKKLHCTITSTHVSTIQGSLPSPTRQPSVCIAKLVLLTAVDDTASLAADDAGTLVDVDLMLRVRLEELPLVLETPIADPERREARHARSDDSDAHCSLECVWAG